MSGLLDHLPSRGRFIASHLSSSGTAKLYVATRSTAPPTSQQVRRDETHALVRTIDKGKAAASGKGKVTDGASGPAAKRARLVAELSTVALTEDAVRGFNVEQLKAACASKNLTVGGKKEELVARLLTHLRAAGGAGPSHDA
jgi:hypothetical protein